MYLLKVKYNHVDSKTVALQDLKVGGFDRLPEQKWSK